ncbi:MAG TPA: hypothetical protein VFU41_12130 [Gemmatimonadales bacterium]|nr:hypothetical protein [Gemmatimonadales bacterium]
MGRKLDLMGRKEVLDKVDVLDGQDLQLRQDVEVKERLVFTGPSDWTPEQAEQYIDWRIQLVDIDVARLRQQLDDLTAMRRRWLAVTGGRSKVFANGGGTGNGNGNGHDPEGH